MARTRQLNIRLTPAEMACLEAVRGFRQSQADAVMQLVLTECERRWHDHGRSGNEETAGFYANALWDYDHEAGRSWSGRPPTPPRQIQVWNRWASAQEIELADAVTAAWRAAGIQRTVTGVMTTALVQACEALLTEAGRTSAHLRDRCAQALAAYRFRQSQPQAAAGGGA